MSKESSVVLAHREEKTNKQGTDKILPRMQ